MAQIQHLNPLGVTCAPLGRPLGERTIMARKKKAPPTPKPKVQPAPAPENIFMTLISINGDVQSRGCRASLKSKAKELKLSGYAINRPDGSVEILTFGPEDALTDFATFAEEAPDDNINVLQHLIPPRPANPLAHNPGDFYTL